MGNANWLLVFWFTWPLTADALNSSFTHDNFELSKTTLFILKDHLSKPSSTLVILEHGLVPETTQINIRLLDYLLLNLQDAMTVQLFIGARKDQLWKYYVFIVDSFEAFRVLRWRFPINVSERQFYFLIVLTKYTPNIHQVLKRIFRLCYEFQVIDVNVIAYHPSMEVCMFTYELFSKTSCHTVHPILYFRFGQASEQLGTIFPCLLKVAGRVFEPMLIFTGNTSNPKPVGYWENLSGLEGTLLKFIARSLNFTIDLLPLSKERSYIHDNLTVYGCFSQLVNGEGDVAVGGLSGSESNVWILSSTMGYYQSPFVYIVRSGTLLSSLGRLARPFNYEVWILIAVFLILGIFIVKIVQLMKPAIRRAIFGERNGHPVTNLLAIFLGYSVPQTPRRNVPRYLLMTWLLLNPILRNAYQGSLYDAIRLDTFVKIPSGLLLSPEIAYLSNINKNQTIIVESGDWIQRLKILETTRERYATIIIRDYFTNYMGTAYKSDSDLIMSREVIYMCQIGMFFPKNSIYLAAFNKKLEAFMYSGIKGHVRGHFSNDRYLVKEKSPRKAFTNKQLEGIYEIYMFMATLSLVIFGLELLSVHSVSEGSLNG